MKTERLTENDLDIDRAADLLRGGSCVAFPTETVYGLGADATQGEAVARIYAAKERPRFNPLIIHVADTEVAYRLGIFDETASRLAEAFWPGPVTLVVPLAANHGLSDLVTAGLSSVGLRVPGAAVAQRLLLAVGRPIAAPSANPSGRISPTTATHVLAGLDGKIAAVVDGGPCAVGLESTIVGCVGPATLLRPGGVSEDAVTRVLGHSLAVAEPQVTPVAPGQLASHYAPGKPVRLNADAARPGELMLGFGPGNCDINLSHSGDLVEAAAALFDALHDLDQMDGVGIAVAPVPESGLGVAINDRLRRAAAPRG